VRSIHIERSCRSSIFRICTPLEVRRCYNEGIMLRPSPEHVSKPPSPTTKGPGYLSAWHQRTS
jgi:hypothetical protein